MVERAAPLPLNPLTRSSARRARRRLAPQGRRPRRGPAAAGRSCSWAAPASANRRCSTPWPAGRSPRRRSPGRPRATRSSTTTSRSSPTGSTRPCGTAGSSPHDRAGLRAEDPRRHARPRQQRPGQPREAACSCCRSPTSCSTSARRRSTTTSSAGTVPAAAAAAGVRVRPQQVGPLHPRRRGRPAARRGPAPRPEGRGLRESAALSHRRPSTGSDREAGKTHVPIPEGEQFPELVDWLEDGLTRLEIEAIKARGVEQLLDDMASTLDVARPPDVSEQAAATRPVWESELNQEAPELPTYSCRRSSLDSARSSIISPDRPAAISTPDGELSRTHYMDSIHR